MSKLVIVENNEVVVSSRQVAEHFEKQHKDVLESIRNILAAENSVTRCEKGRYGMRVTTINNIETPVIEYNGLPVVTTEQLAWFYDCKKDAISHNFKNNESRFVEGKHFYKLIGNELRSFKASLGTAKISQNLKFAPYVYLWTKQGAARHSKMLGTDRAWDMFDLLEENYFSKNNQLALPKDYLSALKALVASEEAKQKALAENAIMKPKADFYDTVVSTESLLSMGDTAKLLDKNVGRNRLYKILREKKILMSDNIPYQQYVDRGYFKVVENYYMAGDNKVITKTTYVKQKGVDYIRKLLKEMENKQSA